MARLFFSLGPKKTFSDMLFLLFLTKIMSNLFYLVEITHPGSQLFETKKLQLKNERKMETVLAIILFTILISPSF